MQPHGQNSLRQYARERRPQSIALQRVASKTAAGSFDCSIPFRTPEWDSKKRRAPVNCLEKFDTAPTPLKHLVPHRVTKRPKFVELRLSVTSLSRSRRSEFHGRPPWPPRQPASLTVP